MPWIRVIRESEAEGEVKEAYARMREVNQSYEAAWPNERPLDPRRDDNVITPPMLASLSPKAMLHGRELMMEIMRGPSRLTPAQREMIATVTSITTDCRY
jgi:hypothetical protein